MRELSGDQVQCPYCLGEGTTPKDEECSCCSGKGLLRRDSPYASDQLRPFIEVARKKGVQLTYSEVRESREPPSVLHLDMDMVDASVRDAIRYADSHRMSQIRERLERLLKNGSASEKVAFVYRSGRYYFPEDIERLAKKSREMGAMNATAQSTCQVVCNVVCHCVSDPAYQDCQNICNQICRLE